MSIEVTVLSELEVKVLSSTEDPLDVDIEETVVQVTVTDTANGAPGADGADEATGEIIPE